MSRKKALLLAVFLLLTAGCSERYGKYYAEYVGLFGTDTLLIGYARNQAEFDRYAGIVTARMEALHRLYDIYYEYEGVNNLRTVNKNAGITQGIISSRNGAILCPNLLFTGVFLFS